MRLQFSEWVDELNVATSTRDDFNELATSNGTLISDEGGDPLLSNQLILYFIFPIDKMIYLISIDYKNKQTEQLEKN